MKKTLLIVIDALCARVVRPALDAGRLPNLQKLAENGTAHWESVSVFPSITPAATASIVTGAYPAEHKIMGAYFYDRATDRVRYYGPDFWVVVEKGIADFVDGFLVKMNRDVLQAETLWEKVELAGLEAASLNYLLFRGIREHEARTPWTLRLLPSVPWSAQLKGPATLCLGDFAHRRLTHERSRKLESTGGPFQRFGFQDDTTGQLLMQLQQQGMPDFTLAYFPDNDFESHERGPEAALETVEKVDRHLGQFIDQFGGVPAMLEELAVLVTGDHGHDDIASDERRATVELEEVLDDFSLATAGTAWDEGDELMICPNLRAAQIYVRESAEVRLAELVARLLDHPGVDQMIWQVENGPGGKTIYHVATSQRGRLEFRPLADDDPLEGDSWRHGTDVYGQRWSCRGNLAAVDARLQDGRLTFGDYPNALERIAMGFEPRRSGDVWLTARPGCEFSYPGVNLHVGGGSHGSLHASDSLSPLLAAGLPANVEFPPHARLVDIAPLVLCCLGLECDPWRPRPHAGRLSTAS